jgi:hypothetical protein
MTVHEPEMFDEGSTAEGGVTADGENTQVTVGHDIKGQK